MKTIKDINRESNLFKFSLLSVGLLAQIAPAVSAAIPAMSQTLRNVSQSQVELLTSVPNFGLMLLVFFSPIIVRHFGAKATTMAGIILTLVCGIIPIFTDNYPLILISRFLLGCGIGMFNSLGTSLIALFYQGQEKTKLIGYSNALAAAGSTVATFSVGLLLQYGWHITYTVYFLSIIPLIFFGLFIPRIPKNLSQINSNEETGNEKIKLSPVAIFYSIYAIFMYLAYMTVVFKLATLVIQSGAGNASQASIIISLVNIIQFFSGLLFAKAVQAFKRRTMIFACFIMGLSFILMSMSHNLFLTAVLDFIAGFVFAWINPFMMNDATNYSNANSQVWTTSMIVVGINLGCFLNPIFNQLIGQIFHNQRAEFSALSAGVLFLICLIVDIIFEKTYVSKHPNKRS